jgi:hypothetical protein
MEGDDEATGREAFDHAAYERPAPDGPCFVCRLVARDPAYRHDSAYEDDDHVAFLDRYLSLLGKTLVAPKRHIEQVVGGMDEEAMADRHLDRNPGAKGRGAGGLGPSRFLRRPAHGRRSTRGP